MKKMVMVAEREEEGVIRNIDGKKGNHMRMM